MTGASDSEAADDYSIGDRPGRSARGSAGRAPSREGRALLAELDDAYEAAQSASSGHDAEVLRTLAGLVVRCLDEPSWPDASWVEAIVRRGSVALTRLVEIEAWDDAEPLAARLVAAVEDPGNELPASLRRSVLDSADAVERRSAPSASAAGSRAKRGTGARGALLRLLGPIVGLVGTVLLVVAEFTELVRVRVITVVPEGGTLTAGEHHGYALAVIGGAALVMVLLSAATRARALARMFATAVAVLGLAALLIALLKDLPVLDDVGLIGERYDQAQAEARAGFYVETLGAVLLMIAGVGMALFGAGPRSSGDRG